MSSRIALGGFVISVPVALLLVYELLQWPTAEEHRARLVAEFDSIAAPNSASLLREASESKPGLALATRTYMSTAPNDVIVQHYDGVLSQSGWSLRPPRGYPGQPDACFSRGDESAAVFFWLPRTGDQRYDLTLSWGSIKCP